ncbi:hypothetical protein DH2020_014046 [Rehmannia glutinosa]|uniref:RRM domain-containing protein n=1 Tax=Rehmannia glutinosa TaxID=99300 RepID=A0ABR0WXT8_REHGL
MAKKRKLDSQLSQLPQKIEEEEHIFEEEEEEDPSELAEEEVEEEEEEEEEIEEVEEEEEEEVEEEEVEGEEEVVEEVEEEEEEEADDEDEEPIRDVVSLLTKEVLFTLLAEAAERHPDVAARVRESADADPSQRKIFVHGLKRDTTSEMLFVEFLKYGEIEDCRLVTDKTSGRCRGYGFVLFKSGRGARGALKEPQKMINNRMTTCQLASVGPIAPPPPPQNQKVQMHQQSEYTQRKIFVSNVGAELDPRRLHTFFSQYGEIEEGPLGLDKETGKPKGFCLFVYKTVESAKLALSEPHKQFEGFKLHCRKAIDGLKPHKMQITQQFVDNVSMVGSTGAVQAQQPQLLNVDPAALGQALTTLIAAQSGLNLLGALGTMGAGTGQMNNPAAVMPGFGSQVVQDGYGMGWYGNQGGYPNQQNGHGNAGGSQHGG